MFVYLPKRLAPLFLIEEAVNNPTKECTFCLFDGRSNLGKLHCNFVKNEVHINLEEWKETLELYYQADWAEMASRILGTICIMEYFGKHVKVIFPENISKEEMVLDEKTMKVKFNPQGYVEYEGKRIPRNHNRLFVTQWMCGQLVNHHSCPGEFKDPTNAHRVLLEDIKEILNDALGFSDIKSNGPWAQFIKEELLRPGRKLAVSKEVICNLAKIAIRARYVNAFTSAQPYNADLADMILPACKDLIPTDELGLLYGALYVGLMNDSNDLLGIYTFEELLELLLATAVESCEETSNVLEHYGQFCDLRSDRRDWRMWNDNKYVIHVIAKEISQRIHQHYAAKFAEVSDI